MNTSENAMLSGPAANAWGRVLASVHEKQRDSIRMKGNSDVKTKSAEPTDRSDSTEDKSESTAMQSSSPESRHRKEEALANHEAHQGNLLLQVRHIFIRHLLERGQVTADDIRGKFEIPEGVNPNFLGSVPTPFTRGLIIKRISYVESTRPAAHARVVSLWQLIDHQKAEQWLLDNPLSETEGE